MYIAGMGLLKTTVCNFFLDLETSLADMLLQTSCIVCKVVQWLQYLISNPITMRKGDDVFCLSAYDVTCKKL